MHLGTFGDKKYSHTLEGPDLLAGTSVLYLSLFALCASFPRIITLRSMPTTTGFVQW